MLLRTSSPVPIHRCWAGRSASGNPFAANEGPPARPFRGTNSGNRWHGSWNRDGSGDIEADAAVWVVEPERTDQSAGFSTLSPTSSPSSAIPAWRALKSDGTEAG